MLETRISESLLLVIGCSCSYDILGEDAPPLPRLEVDEVKEPCRREPNWEVGLLSAKTSLSNWLASDLLASKGLA